MLIDRLRWGRTRKYLALGHEKPFQCLFNIPPSIISLSLIPTAANCDLKLFSLLLEFKVLDSYRI